MVGVVNAWWCKCRQKKVNYPLKGQLTKRERQPQEPYVVPTGMTQEVKAKTGRTIDVNEQPPATQLTTNNTLKHNANGHTGWGAKMQGQTKKILPEVRGWRFFEAGEANPCQL